MANFIERLHQRLQQPLPGLPAQWQMASRNMRLDEATERYAQLPENHRLAGVLCLVYPRESGWHTALMQRPESPYAHSRQVSFPGGMHEPSDENIQATALREAWEEFGVRPESVQILGKLSPLYIPVSNFLVHPFVGHLAETPVFQRDPNEVEEILETPLDWVLDPARRRLTDIPISERGTLREVPYFDFHQRVVWGATAMMLSEFAAILEEIQPQA